MRPPVAGDVRGAIDAGHFLANQGPEEVTAELRAALVT
jgi:hypothetical protein